MTIFQLNAKINLWGKNTSNPVIADFIVNIIRFENCICNDGFLNNINL